MFNSYEFTFAGKSSLMYGLTLYDIDGKGQEAVSFGNKASILEARTNRRIQPLHFGVNYHNAPLQFKMTFGTDRPLDRFEFENISLWLTGHQSYQWLSIGQPDLEHVQFRCLITEMKPIFVSWLPYAFEATVTCDCPYAYSYPFEDKFTISGTTEILLRNKSSVREYLKPHLTFSTNSGVNTISIVNKDDNNRKFMIENSTGASLASTTIEIDNTNGIITDKKNGANLYGGFNMNFFRLVQGDNHIVVTGNGTMTVSGRFLHNVAA